MLTSCIRAGSWANPSGLALHSAITSPPATSPPTSVGTLPSVRTGSAAGHLQARRALMVPVDGL